MKKVQSVQRFSDSRKYLCWAFEASNRGLSKSPRLHTKKSKASKELKGKNDLIGWWQSISGWIEFLGRLDALDAHFRDRVSEYEKSPKRPRILRLPQIILLCIWSLQSRFIKKSKEQNKKVQSVQRIEGKKWFHWLMAEHQRLDWIPWTLGRFGHSF